MSDKKPYTKPTLTSLPPNYYANTIRFLREIEAMEQLRSEGAVFEYADMRFKVLLKELTSACEVTIPVPKEYLPTVCDRLVRVPVPDPGFTTWRDMVCELFDMSPSWGLDRVNEIGETIEGFIAESSELKSRAEESRKEAERAEARYAVLKHEFAAKLGLQADATVEEIVSQLHLLLDGEKA